MSKTKISQVLCRLSMKSLRDLAGIRGLEGHRESSFSLASRLAKSYKGDFDTLFGDLNRRNLIDLFSLPVEIDGKASELRNKSRHKVEDLREIARKVFIGELIVPEFDVIDLEQIANVNELSKLIENNSKIPENLDLSHRDLQGFDFSGCTLLGTNFTETNLAGANFEGAKLTNVQLKSANLIGSKWQRSILTKIQLDNGSGVRERLEDAEALIGATLLLGAWADDDYSGMNLSDTRIYGVSFNPAFDGCDFSNAVLSLETIGEGSFKHAKFYRTVILNIEHDMPLAFSKALFEDTKLGNRLDFEGIDLKGAIFKSVNFDGLSFSGAVLDNAEFEACNFDSSNFSAMNIKGVDFSGCSFAQAVFSTGTIENVDFSDCNMAGSQFHSGLILRTKFVNADLEAATFDRSCTVEECDFSHARMTRADNEEILASQPLAFPGAEFTDDDTNLDNSSEHSFQD